MAALGALLALLLSVAPAQAAGAEKKQAAGAEERLTAEQVRALLLSADKSTLTVENKVIDGKLDLEGAEINRAVIFAHCRFSGPAIFINTTFKKWLSFDDSVFLDMFSLNGASVGATLFLRGTTARRGVDISFAKIGLNIEAEDAEWVPDRPITDEERARSEYPDSLGRIKFDHVQTGADLFLYSDKRTARFELPVSLTSAVIKGKLLARSAVFRAGVDFSGANVSGLVSLPSALFEGGPVVFNLITVGDVLDVNAARFSSDTSFYDARLATLTMIDTTWPPPPVPLHLDGMSYRWILSAPGHSDEKILPFVDRADFSPGNYLRLESMYRAQGQPELADDTYVAMRRRQRSTLAWFSKPWDYLQWSVVRYGRQPGLALLWAIPFLLAGMLIFNKRRMVPQREELARYPYSSFWFSLDLFAPIIDLDAARLWMPRPDYKLGLLYQRIHRIVGWLLIPFALASLTGILK